MPEIGEKQKTEKDRKAERQRTESDTDHKTTENRKNIG